MRTVAVVLSMLCAGSIAWWGTPSADAADSSFTYQGRLAESGLPEEGQCDFEFALYDAASAGTQLGVVEQKYGVDITDGVFTVQLDFGSAPFNGGDRWIRIAVRCPAGAGSFTTLSPRQQLTATPYALHAEQAGGVPWSGVSGVPSGLADGVDDNTTYTAGTGLQLSSDQFSADTNVLQSRVTAFCAAGSSIRQIAADGTVTCETDNDSGGDITGVSAGSGLSGGGLSGDVSLSVSFAGAGAAATAARSDHNHDGNYANVSHDHFGEAWSGLADTGLEVTTVGTYGIRGVVSAAGPSSPSARAGAASGTGGKRVIPLFAPSPMTVGVYGASAARNGYGVKGEATDTAGFGTGVSGASDAFEGTGVYGEAEGGLATGVTGWARAGSGATTGVFGRTDSIDFGKGVYGWAEADSGTGVGVHGKSRSADGVGVYAEGSGPTGTALKISNGAIRVKDAGLGTNTAAFIHRATAPHGDYTIIDHPMTNNDPNVILIVTQNWNPGGTVPNVYNAHPIGVFYAPASHKWAIFNEDLVTMPTNAAFNVLVIKP